MIRTAFSTVACPTWTLDRVARAASEWGFMGVELRSMGEGATEFACDPGLTSGAKVREMFREAGVSIAGVASGVRFDAPVFPPVLGHVLPQREASVREGKHMVMLSQQVGAAYVRVFGFEITGREGRASALRRIVDRLSKVCDAARGRGVTVLIENGGTFAKAEDLVEIIERVRGTQLAASYDVATAHAAGEDPAVGAAALGARLRVMRLRDLRGDRAVRLGKGEVPVRPALAALRTLDRTWGTDPWAVYAWDRAWIQDLAPADEVMPGVAETIAEWAGGLGEAHRTQAFQSAAPAMIFR